MCLCPKVFVHRSNHFDCESMPVMFQVPCGKCDECCNRARNDWFVRCWLEHQYSSVQTFFYTLTYNNENLPTFNGLPVFRKTDIQKFMKRLRYNLGEGVKCRYFVSSEFGTKYGRPHYHALFFLDRSFNPFVFYKLVEKSWHYGFVKYGDNAGVIYGTKGIQYVTKYVTKDLLYTDEFCGRLQRICFDYVTRVYNRLLRLYRLPSIYYIDIVRGSVKYYTTVLRSVSIKSISVSRLYIDDVYKSRHLEHENMFLLLDKIVTLYNRLYRSQLPFHLQSTKLGVAGIDLSCPVENIPLLTSDSFVRYSLPRYFKRLFWYDCVENETDGKRTKFVLNEKGKEHFLKVIDDTTKRLKDTYVSIISTPHSFDDDMLADINKRLPIDTTFYDSRDLSFFLHNFDLDFDVLAVYNAIFRGRYCPFDFEEIALNNEIVLDNYWDYYRHCLYEVSDYDFGRIYENKHLVNAFVEHIWNKHPFFAPYEFASCLLNAISAVERGLVFKKLSNDDLMVRKLKENLRF